jgi:hypothetical protein
MPGQPLPVARLFLLAGLLAVLVYAASVAALPRRYGHIVVGDGVHYYVYLRSLVHDGDLDFTNDYAVFNQAITDPEKQINIDLRTPTGLALNMFAIGPALASLPLYLVAHVISLAGSATGLPLPTDGFGPLYEGAFALSGVLASIAAAACAYAALRRLLAPAPVLVGVAGIWLGGSLLYYTVASPVYAHSFSAFGVSAWLLAWTRLDGRRLLPWLICGLLGGLMAIMRWQEALFALLPLLLYAYDLVRGRWERPGTLLPHPLPEGEGTPLGTRYSALGTFNSVLAYVLGLVLGFLPQMIAWTVLYGAPLAVPQGGSFFTWDDPHWLDVLVSTRNGLFTWTPVALLGVAGLLALLRRYPRWALVGLLAVVLQIAINGLVADWWGGAAFGARRFIGLSPFLALGLGWLVSLLWPARRRLALAVIAILIALNGLLMLQYSAALKGWTRLDAYPTLRQMTIERFTWPLALLDRR